MREMALRGATYYEIGEKFGRTMHAVEQRLGSRAALLREAEAKKAEPKAEPTEDGHQLEKQKTLNDFTVREMIKNLYERGCRIRIRNNRPLLVLEREIRLSDIIG